MVESEKQFDRLRDASRSPDSNPTFHDLQKHADAGWFKKIQARYYIPKNYEGSIKRHQLLGSPLIRKLVMSTVGRNQPEPYVDCNYRLNRSRNLLEASTHFALRESVNNERDHTRATILTSAITLVSHKINAPGIDLFDVYAAIGVAGTVLNLPLVALQRYNRARLMQRADQELAQGMTFSPGYRNEFGIDERAYANFQESHDATPALSPQPSNP